MCSMKCYLFLMSGIDAMIGLGEGHRMAMMLLSACKGRILPFWNHSWTCSACTLFH